VADIENVVFAIWEPLQEMSPWETFSTGGPPLEHVSRRDML
jgi:hypothetical protein